MSWDLPAMLTILSIGVLNDDDAKIKQALEFFYHGKGMGCIEWSVRGMHEDPEGKVKGRHLAQSQEMAVVRPRFIVHPFTSLLLPLN